MKSCKITVTKVDGPCDDMIETMVYTTKGELPNDFCEKAWAGIAETAQAIIDETSTDTCTCTCCEEGCNTEMFLEPYEETLRF